MKRLVVPEHAIVGDHATVRGPLHHYLCHVLRSRQGDRLVLLDGSGARFDGTVVNISSTEVSIAVDNRRPPPHAQLPRLVLVYGISRRSRTEMVLQKATELGVDWLLPAICARSVSRPADHGRKIERWTEIVTNATQQCGRVTVPLLSPPLPLADALDQVGAECRLLAAPDGVPLSNLADRLGRPVPSVVVAVGPEGGFDEDERRTAAELEYQSVSLGRLVLRTETAAVAALTLVAHLCGRLS